MQNFNSNREAKERLTYSNFQYPGTRERIPEILTFSQNLLLSKEVGHTRGNNFFGEISLRRLAKHPTKIDS